MNPHLQQILHDITVRITKLEEAQQPQRADKQEPVAYIHRNEFNEYRLEPHDNFDIKSIPFNVDVPLFKSPQQRTWVGLTEEDKTKLWDRAEKRGAYQGVPSFIALIQEVEAKLKEKNT